ncbi:MAG: hypothetical protein HYZ28_14510 [Myxococcales bacterium]|nr:hypothetical protein [Myxococcales bacterium]
MKLLLNAAAGSLGGILWLLAATGYAVLGPAVDDTGAGYGALLVGASWLLPAGVLAVALLSWWAGPRPVGQRARLAAACVAGTVLGFLLVGLILWGGLALTDAFPGRSYLARDVFKMSVVPLLAAIPPMGAAAARSFILRRALWNP